jgi:GNAT superfamily N-acetyltransferase
MYSPLPDIRQFKHSDAAASSALIRSCWETMRLGDYDVEGIALQIAGTTPGKLVELSGSTKFYVAEEKKAIVGFGGYNKEKIRLVFVKPGLQRRGIGSLILDRVLSDARNEGIQRLECYSTTDAEPFYMRHGFIKEGIVDFTTIHFCRMSVSL